MRAFACDCGVPTLREAHADRVETRGTVLGRARSRREFVAHRRHRCGVPRCDRTAWRLHRDEATRRDVLRLHPENRRGNRAFRAAALVGTHVEKACRRFTASPRLACRRALHRQCRQDARGQHLCAAPARTDAEAGLGKSNLPRLAALGGHRGNERVAMHRNFETAAERRAVDRGRARAAERGDHRERFRTRTEICIEARVIERIDFRKISACDEHARRRTREHEALRLLGGDRRERRLDLADQPRIKHNHAAARLLGIRLEEEDVDAVADFVGKHDGKIPSLALATLSRMLVMHRVVQGIHTIDLARPDARNALSRELISALADAVDSVAHDPTARVLILGGEGKSFCAGMDLKAVADDPVAMGDMLRALSRASRAIRRLPIPTIARVQGAAIGGGCGLMVVCDFAVTHAEAKLGYPEVDLGICPAVVAPWLMKKIGTGAARAMLLAGGTMSGDEGFHRGLATHLVTESELVTTAQTLAERLAKGGPIALAATKHWLNELDGSLDDAIADEAAEISARIIAGSEAQSRLRAAWSR
jgi:methylglutaconyl-CoA hydratase